MKFMFPWNCKTFEKDNQKLKKLKARGLSIDFKRMDVLDVQILEEINYLFETSFERYWPLP